MDGIEWIRHSSINQTSSGLPVYEFIIDSADKIAALPTMDNKKEFVEKVAAGSIATTKDMSKMFMLFSDGWNEL
jgi:hypothetical protein